LAGAGLRLLGFIGNLPISEKALDFSCRDKATTADCYSPDFALANQVIEFGPPDSDGAAEAIYRICVALAIVSRFSWIAIHCCISVLSRVRRVAREQLIDL
jgi:hypothetical protein